MNELAPLLSGLIVAANIVIGLFFLRFWRQSEDRLFLFFAVAFWILGLQRLLLALLFVDERTSIMLYALRAVGYLIIIYAIIDKNRKGEAA